MWQTYFSHCMMARSFYFPFSPSLDAHWHAIRKFGNNDPHDFAVVSGILRLSTKYAIDSLRSKAITHLNIAWPTTLKGWDLREDKSHAYELTSPTVHAGLYPSPIVRPFRSKSRQITHLFRTSSTSRALQTHQVCYPQHFTTSRVTLSRRSSNR
jgi:hypothetical protein